MTLLAVGAVMYRALLENGYGRHFSIGIICASGVLGIVVPPSIPLILYGVMTETSIADLFVAGIGPALIMIAVLAIYTLARHGRRTAGAWDAAEVRATGVRALSRGAGAAGGARRHLRRHLHRRRKRRRFRLRWRYSSNWWCIATWICAGSGM